MPSSSWLSDQLRRAKRGIVSVAAQYPYSRKSVVTFLLFCLMWVCLTVLSRPYDMAVFSLGTVLLSTDYKVLRTARLDPVYQFVTAPDTIRTVQHQYERKRFDERGPDKIPLDPKGNGDFRGVVAQRVESVHEGLRFRVNVKTEIDMETPPGIKKYHLRLGTVRVTNVSETDDADGGVVVFFSISE